MSYFDDFYNLNGVKTLRSYTRPLNLRRFDRQGWEWRQDGTDAIEKRLLGLRRIPLLTPEMVDRLQPVDRLSYQAGMLNVNHAGLYKPRA
jgi:hypothetical protein